MRIALLFIVWSIGCAGAQRRAAPVAAAEDDATDEVPVAVADLPDAVVNAVLGRFPTGDILEAEREGEAYEVEVLASGVLWEALVAPDGTILEVEAEDADGE